jgi:hypothetical protein
VSRDRPGPDERTGAEEASARQGREAATQPGEKRSARILWMPKSSSASCDQAIFVDQPAGTGLSAGAVLVEVDRFGGGFSVAAPCRQRCGRC